MPDWYNNSSRLKSDPMAKDNNKTKATISLLVEASEPASARQNMEPPTLGAGQVVDAPSKSGGRVSQGSGAGRAIEILAVLRDQHMLVPGSALGAMFQDEYRRIKRPLLSNAFGCSSSLVDHGNLVMVTSSIPGEGKTYTSTNLALSIAREKDVTVLLVDCDISRRGVSRLLQIEGYPGLVDVIENDDIGLGDVLLTTDIPHLRVLPAGRHCDYITELLASKRMRELVEEIASRYPDRFIIFDSPPILATPETQVLGNLVGQIVFVIETGKTPQSVVEDAISSLPEDKAVGVVLNKNEGAAGRSGYYYGYYGAQPHSDD